MELGYDFPEVSTRELKHGMMKRNDDQRPMADDWVLA